MNAIGILEQQQANEVLRLEIAYSNLYKAYMLGDRNKMISHYIATGYIGIPNFAESVQSQTKQEMLSNGILPDILPTSIDNIKDDTLLRMNVVGCLKALQNEINIRNIYRTHYTYAQNILYQPNHIFRQEEVLYQNPYGQQLKVADILAVSKYAVSIAEAIAPEQERDLMPKQALLHGLRRQKRLVRHLTLHLRQRRMKKQLTRRFRFR